MKMEKTKNTAILKLYRTQTIGIGRSKRKKSLRKETKAEGARWQVWRIS
jgi:hypothetical protein